MYPYPFTTRVVVPYLAYPALPEPPTYRLLKRVKEPELVNVNPPPLSQEEDKAIRNVLRGPTNIKLACCSFSFPVNLAKVFLELEEFARDRLNIPHLSLEFFGETVGQILGTNYMVRFLNQHNRPIAAAVRSLEKTALVLHVRICAPVNALANKEVLEKEFLRIVGRNMPLFNEQQISEVNLILSGLRVQGEYYPSVDFRMALAEMLRLSNQGPLKIECVILPRTEEQSRFYLPFNQYLTPAEEEKFVPSAPPLKFTATGLRVFCDTIYHYLAPPTVVVRKSAAQKRLAVHLQDSAHARQKQTQSVESQQRSLQKLKEMLIQRVQESDVVKLTTFKVLTATIFGALPPSREEWGSQGMAHWWLEILTSSDTLGNFALEWAAGLQKRAPAHKQFIGKLFIGFFKQPNKKRLAASFYALLDEKQAVLELANLLNDLSCQNSLHGLLAELTTKEGAARTFLSELTEQLQGKNPRLIGDAWAFLCHWLQNQGKMKRATKIWLEAVQRGVWTQQPDRQIELFLSLSNKIEGSAAEEFLKSVAKLPKAIVENQQFQAAYARLRGKCESSQSRQDSPYVTEYKERTRVLIKQWKQRSHASQSFLNDAEKLIAEFQDKPFFAQNPGEFLSITSKLLFHSSFDKAFFRSNKEEEWHAVVISVMRKAPQGFPVGIETRMRFFKGVLEHLAASKATENLSKKTLKTYHDFLHEFLSCKHPSESPQEVSQSLLVDKLISCSAPLLAAYERQGLYEEGYQLLFDLHIHKNVFVTETSAISSCLGLFAGKLQALPDGSPAISEVERLLKQMPSLMRSFPFFEIQEKQKEVGFLLARKFFTQCPEKSWQLFQGVLNCYPALLSEPKFEKEGAILAEQLYKKLGFPVVDFLLQFFTDGQGKEVPLEPDWRDKFVKKVLQRLLKENCLEDLYLILRKYSDSSYAHKLTPVAAAWVKKATALSGPDLYLFSAGILKIIRLYNIDEPKLWWWVFAHVQGLPGVDLWKELQNAETRNRLQADPLARKECWELAVNRLEESQLPVLLKYKETLLELFSHESSFLVKVIYNLVEDLLKQFRELQKQLQEPLMHNPLEHLLKQTIDFKQKKESLKAFVDEVLKSVSLTENQRVALEYYAKQLTIIAGIHDTRSLSVEIENADENLNQARAAIGVDFNKFLYASASCIMLINKLKENGTDVLPKRIQLQNLSREVLFAASTWANSLLPDQIISVIFQIQLLCLSEEKNESFLLYQQYWQALVKSCQKSATQTRGEVVARNLKSSFFHLFNKLIVERQLYQHAQLQGELLKNENALDVFTAEERADLLALASSCEIDRVFDDLTRFDELVAERLPAVFKHATIEKKDRFLALVFTSYARIAVKKDSSRIFFGSVDKAKSLVSARPTEEEKEGSRKAELEMEKCALKFVLINYDIAFKDATQQVRTEFLEGAAIRVECLVKNMAKPGEDKDLVDILKSLICHKALSGPDQAKSVTKYLQNLQQRYSLFSKNELFERYFYLKRLDPRIKIPVKEFLSLELASVLSPAIIDYLENGKDRVNCRLACCVSLVMDCQIDMFSGLKEQSAVTLELTALVNMYNYLFLFKNKHASHFTERERLTAAKNFFFAIKKLFDHVDDLFPQKSEKQKKLLAKFVVDLSTSFFNWYTNVVITRTKDDSSASITFKKEFVKHLETSLTTYVLKYGCYVDDQAPLRRNIQEWHSVLLHLDLDEAINAAQAITKKAKELNFDLSFQHPFSGLMKNRRAKKHSERKK